MVGRKIYSDPLFLCEIDEHLFTGNSHSPIVSLNNFMEYILTLENKNDVNRAITHLMQLLKSLSIQKTQRNKLLTSLKDNSFNMGDLFKDFQVDLLQKNPIPNL